MTAIAISMAALCINLALVSITMNLRRVAEALEEQNRLSAEIGRAEDGREP